MGWVWVGFELGLGFGWVPVRFRLGLDWVWVELGLGLDWFKLGWVCVRLRFWLGLSYV